MSSGWWQSTALVWESPARTPNRSEPKLQVRFDFGLSANADSITAAFLHLFHYLRCFFWCFKSAVWFHGKFMNTCWAIFTCVSIVSLQSLIFCFCSARDPKTWASVFEVLNRLIQSFWLKHKRTASCLALQIQLTNYIIVLLVSKEC